MVGSGVVLSVWGKGGNLSGHGHGGVVNGSSVMLGGWLSCWSNRAIERLARKDKEATNFVTCLYSLLLDR
jgi:hypothetical protein